MLPLRQPHLVEHFGSSFARIVPARNLQRQCNIAQRGQALNQVKRLKNNTQVIATQICEGIGIKRVDIPAIEFYFAGLRLLETSQ